jgi:hypothetical protein
MRGSGGSVVLTAYLLAYHLIRKPLINYLGLKGVNKLATTSRVMPPNDLTQ